MGRGLVMQRSSYARRAGGSAEGGGSGGRVAVQTRGDERPIWMTMVMALAAALAILASGCSMTDDEKKDDIYSGYDGSQYEGAGQAGESDLPGDLQEGSSLDHYRQGTLGGGSQGPLDDIYFDYDSYSLSMDARELIDLNAEWLRANGNARIEIEGHCDSRGTIEYNLGLGARRATAVRDYLVSIGISPERMSTISYGKELPVCQDETPSCWSRNRRTHLVVLS